MSLFVGGSKGELAQSFIILFLAVLASQLIG